MISKKDSLFLKGLSILLLVYHHNLYTGVFFKPIQSNTRIVVWIFLFITAYGLSAQFESMQNKNPFKFILKRLVLLYIPLWICNIVNLLLVFPFETDHVFSFITGSPINIIVDLLNLSFYFGTPGLFSGWYINMLVLLIALFPFIYFFVSKLKWLSILPVLLIVWFFKWKIYYMYGGYLDEYLLIYILGILFYKYKCFSIIPKINNHWRIPIIAFLVMLFLISMCLRNEYIPYVTDTLILRFDPFSTFIALAVIASVFALRQDNKVSSVFAKLGTYSADIFYIHSSFYNVVFVSLGIINPYITFFLCFLLSLLLAVIIEMIKEKIGFNKKLRNCIDRLLKLS